MDDRMMTSSTDVIHHRRGMRGEMLFSVLKSTFCSNTGRARKSENVPVTPIQVDQTKKCVEAAQNLDGSCNILGNKVSDAGRRGIRRILLGQVQQVTCEGFLHFHNPKSGHLGRNRLVGHNWIRVWCALEDTRLHVIQNVPSRHFVLPLEDHMIQASAGAGSNAPVTFAVVAFGETAAPDQQRFLFKAACPEERDHWLSALQKSNAPARSRSN